MAAIQNINNNTSMIMLRPNAQSVQDVDTKIAKIDKGIESNNKLIELFKEKKTKLENLINSNEKYIQTLQESKELDKKRISIFQDTNDKLQTLLDRNSNKIDASDVKLLDKQLDTFTKKESVLKAQAATVDTKIEKLAARVEFTKNQITKLEANSKNIETSNVQVKPDKNSFANGYRPTADQIAKLELSKINQEFLDFDMSDTLFQQKIRYSQKNIYESIVNSFLKKLV